MPCRDSHSSREGPFKTIYYRCLWPPLEFFIMNNLLSTPMLVVGRDNSSSNVASDVELCGRKLFA